MPPTDLSGEYYRLRAEHEQALALIATSREKRDAHLRKAGHYQRLADEARASIPDGD